MKISKYIAIFLGCLVLSIALAAFRSGYMPILPMGSNQTSALFGFIIYTVVTWLLLRSDKAHKPAFIVLAVFIGVSIIDVSYRLTHFKLALWTLPPLLIHWLGILTGYIGFVMKNRSKKTTFIIINSIICLWVVFYGQDLLLNKLSFGTFTGRIDEKLQYDLHFQTENGDALSVDNFKGKYLLLDFWSTSCGVCYRKMPQVQALYDKYKSDNSIAIYTLHSRYEKRSETFSTGAQILKKEGYSIPALSIDMNDPILEEMGVRVVPTVLVFDKAGELIFRGNIESATKVIDGYLN